MLSTKNYSQLLKKARKKNKNEILVLHFNCRKILLRLEEIQYIINNLDPDLIIFSETWLDDSTPDLNIFDGYNMIRKDRTDLFKEKHNKKYGGGVAILHKISIKIEKINQMCDDTEDILWTKIKDKNGFMLGALYRPDYSKMLQQVNVESTLEKNIRIVTENSKNSLILGDFNANLLQNKKPETKSLRNIFKMHGFKQIIKEPTRIDPATGSESLLDHIWVTNEFGQIISSGTLAGISDHKGIYVKIKRDINHVKPVKKIKVRNFKEYNASAFAKDVQIKLEMKKSEMENCNVNEAVNSLVKIISDTAESHAPIIEVKLSNKKKDIPWYNKDLTDLIKKKNELLIDSYHHGMKRFKNRITFYTNRIKNTKKKLKRNYIIETIKAAGKNPRKLWKLYNLLVNKQKAKVVTEPSNINQEKANAYNEYFSEVGIETQNKIKTNSQLKSLRSRVRKLNKASIKFAFTQITPEAVTKIIENIKLNTAIGLDNIGPKMIKDIKHVLSNVLADLINRSFEEGVFPQCLKSAIITPIFKEGDKEEIKNYRPISVLTTISKIFERAVSDQLSQFLEINKLISKYQHAYRKKHSSTTCLFEILNLVYKCLDEKKYVAIASLDLSKAFDSINHQLLLEKLKKTGLDDKSLQWINSYLSNRSQCTKFENYTSTFKPVVSGVPQGSILGPLLFLIFVNDLPNSLENICNIFSYADDTQLVIHANSPEELKSKLQKALCTSQKWYQENSMLNNSGKTKILIFKHKKQQLNLKITLPWKDEEGNPIILKPKPHIKVLGVYIDADLSWTKHINILKRRTLNITRNLHRINYLLPKQHRLTLYNALISSHFNYADVIYGGCNKKLSKSLQIVQNFAAKSITGSRKYDSATAALRQLKLLTLKQRRTIHEVVFAHKIILEKTPITIYNQYQCHFSKANTRLSKLQKFRIPKHRTTKFQRSPLYRTIIAWNNAPKDLPKENVKTHKKLLQDRLIAENTCST